MQRILSPQTVSLISASVPALEAYGAEITAVMYRKLFEDAEIAALFNQANQKSGTQIQALAGAILAYARNIQNLSALGGAIERIAQKHIGYAIHSEHYPYVASALLGAIEEVLGDGATPDILAAWGEAYWFLSELLQGRETEIRAEISSHEGGWQDWRRFVISDRRSESETITSFVLRPQDEGKVVPHRPGQYLTFRFDLTGLVGVKRNYSISCAPNADHYRITVKREPAGAASNYLHDHGKIGTVVECTPPAGDFFLPASPPRPVILLSGGVGLTPMVSMLETISDQHGDVPTWYVHGTTNFATHAFRDHVSELAAHHDHVIASTFYEQVEEEGAALSGLITLEWLAENTPLEQADIYLCGPRPFLRFFVNGLCAAGVSNERIHYEFFGPADESLAA